jgi:hypothetical protein
MFNQFSFLGFTPYQAAKKIDEIFKKETVKLEDVLNE